MTQTYLLLGSNQGNRLQNLKDAKEGLSRKVGNITRESSIYITAAWGITDQPDFLNQVLVMDTPMSAEELLYHLLAIEKQMGRERTYRNAPRLIDIDILFFGKQHIVTKELVIPHPRMSQRRFVLAPLNQLAPAMKHPVLQLTMHQLLHQCTDPLDVKKFSAEG